VFDDWNSLDGLGENLGQKKAFPEFLAENPQLTATPYDSYGKNGQIYLIKKKQKHQSTDLLSIQQ
jgi:hypothetical protein